jgi:maltooligosyltrehalose trehalohydrolase
VPMLFMGEEYAASTPFLFFCDFAPELAVAVREGRRAEFARFAAFADPAGRERIPDPGAPATFEASKLRWDERDGGGHRERLELVRELIRCRRAHIVPRLAGAHASGLAEIVNGALRVAWAMGDGSRLRLTVNFQPAAALVPAEKGDIVWQSGVRVSPGNELTLDPGGVYVLLQHG